MGAQVEQARYAKPGRATDRAPRRFRPHHPRRRQGQRAVDQPYRYVLDASLDHAPARRGHRHPSKRMERVGDRLLPHQTPGAMSLSRPARARPIWRSPSRRSCIRAALHARRFFTTVDLVNRLEQEKAAGRSGRLAEYLLRLRPRHPRRTRLSAVQRSSGGAVAVPSDQQALRATPRVIITTNLAFAEWPQRLRRSEDDDGPARPAHASLRHRRNRQRQLALQEPRLTSRSPHAALAPAAQPRPAPPGRALPSVHDIRGVNFGRRSGSTLNAD